jgi:hypothetical protein
MDVEEAEDRDCWRFGLVWGVALDDDDDIYNFMIY